MTEEELMFITNLVTFVCECVRVSERERERESTKNILCSVLGTGKG